MPESAFATALVAGLSDAVIHVNTEGRIQVWNAGAERIFGFTAAEAVGQTLDLIIPPSLRDRHNDGFAATMRTGHTKYGDGDILSVPALRKDGSRISVEFSIVPFADAAGIMRDVTARFEELRTLRRENAALRAGQR
jgi:PAS domain S-box-containing protein